MSVPDAFREHLEEWGAADAFGADGGRTSPERLAEAGACALARSVAPEGRARRGAFDLLAADALLTRAAELALGSDDPSALLTRMASWIAAGGQESFDATAGRAGASGTDTTD